MTNFNRVDWLATSLVIAGSLNWGVTGLGILLEVSNPFTSWNPVNILFGGLFNGFLEGLIYSLIGIAGLYEVYVGYKFAASED